MKNIDNREFDFLKNLALAKDVIVISNIYIDYSNFLITNDPHKALSIINEGILAISKFKNKDIEFNIQFSKARVLLILEQFAEAYELLMDCYLYYKKIDNREMIVKSLGNMADIFFKLKRHKQAHFIWNLLLKKYIDPRNKYLIHLTLNNLMIVYYTVYKIDKIGEEKINEILQIYNITDQSSTDEILMYCFTLSNYGRYYKMKKEYHNALEFFRKASYYYSKNNFEVKNLDIYFEIGEIYSILGEEEQMLIAFDNALKIGEKYNLKLLFSQIYEKIYKYYKTETKYKLAFSALENKIKYDQLEASISKNLLIAIKEMGLENQLENNDSLLLLLNGDFSNLEQTFFIENTHKEIIKIELENILIVKNEGNRILVHLAEDDKIELNISYKEFISLINNNNFNSKLLFETTKNSQIVNLLWISNLNFKEKLIFLKSVHNEFKIKISKRRLPELKKLFSTY